MMITRDFTASVDSRGQAKINLRVNQPGYIWKVQSVTFALGQQASAPQAAAHINGVPLMPSVPIRRNILRGRLSRAMETVLNLPSSIVLGADDSITCAVMDAHSGDTFTASVYAERLPISAMSR